MYICCCQDIKLCCLLGCPEVGSGTTALLSLCWKGGVRRVEVLSHYRREKGKLSCWVPAGGDLEQLQGFCYVPHHVTFLSVWRVQQSELVLLCSYVWWTSQASIFIQQWHNKAVSHLGAVTFSFCSERQGWIAPLACFKAQLLLVKSI